MLPALRLAPPRTPPQGVQQTSTSPPGPVTVEDAADADGAADDDVFGTSSSNGNTCKGTVERSTTSSMSCAISSVKTYEAVAASSMNECFSATASPNASDADAGEGKGSKDTLPPYVPCKMGPSASERRVSARQRAIEFAKQVPKPKVRARAKPGAVLRERNGGDGNGDGGGGAGAVAGNRVELSEIDELLQRREAAKADVDSIARELAAQGLG